MEAATTEPQEDCLCGLVEELLATEGLLLASVISLLSGTSGLLIAACGGLPPPGERDQPPVGHGRLAH